jgi:flagellar FliL protein
MAEATIRESPADERAAPATKRGAWSIVVAGAGLALACGTVAAWRFDLLAYGTPAEATDEIRETRRDAGALLALDPFIANLADEDGKRYLKATVQLEFFSGRVPPDVNARLPQMRDLLLTLFTSKQFAEIRTTEGKALLREEIINRVNRALRRDLVKAVYFTEFIVE